MECPDGRPLSIESPEETRGRDMLTSASNRINDAIEGFDAFASDRRLEATQVIADEAIRATYRAMMCAFEDVSSAVESTDFKAPTDVDNIVGALESMQFALSSLESFVREADLSEALRDECSGTGMTVGVFKTKIRIKLPL